ncbi:hypothetical protein COV18_06390 [Candidatus Woesearchaeota archaeon CG10_big_fil_rev_8_21_14_0_10_37_12]|nr:MAG: hypothetical protein COV18_06390 [Candidatus Woesearchaeota archaeon CG10_big_fil_rev_8_21_14_0_10_37_12]
MTDEKKSPEHDEYELLPHREIEDLKSELAKLKEFEIAPSKRLQVSLLELNTKLDKLITIFEDATHELRIEEGGLSFSEKMRPMLDKMNKILEQNSEIASAVLTLADMVKGKGPTSSRSLSPEFPPLERESSLPPLPKRFEAPSFEEGPELPPLPYSENEGLAPPFGREFPGSSEDMIVPGVPPGPPLPPLPRKRTFGL